MPIQISQPASDVTIEWPFGFPSSPSTHFTRVDEGEPGNTTDYNRTRGRDKTEQYGYPADSGATWDTITRVDIIFKVRAQQLSENPIVEFSLWSGGVQKGDTLAINTVTAAAWKTFGVTFEPLTLTPAQYDALQLRMRTTIGAGDEPHFER